ncbi:BACK domain-containing protein, partial [Haematococcus lacustris]
MYEGKLAEEVKDPLTLARVCRVAERWAFSSLSSSCLQRLADLPYSQLRAEQLVLVLQTLPDSCALLPEHKKWQQLVNGLVISQYGDVHAVITNAQLRGYFQQLPFAAVKQWAGSDELTVDSENSVVELISLWMAGPGGQACSQEQEQQLSCLVRVQHLSSAYALGRLPALAWFDILGASTTLVAQAACCGCMSGVLAREEAPDAWFAVRRKQLKPAELLRRTTIRWDVPRQQLVDLLASMDLTAKV